MADTTNLSQFLSDVADAIRTKKETTEQIPAENFDQEILSIETGIDTSDATATASDIVVDKTAYVNNTKLTGTIQTLTKDDAPYMLPTTHPSYSTFGSSTLVSNAPEYGDYLYLTNGNYGNVGYVIEFPIDILPVDIRGKNILIRYFKDYIVGYDWIDFCVTEYTNSFKGSYHDGTYNILCVDENGTSANFTYYYYTQQNLTFDSITPDSWTLSTSAPSGKSNKQNGYSYSTKKVISTSNSSLVLIPASEDYKFIVKTNVGTSGLKKYVKDEAVLDTKINTTELAEKAGLTSDKILEGNTILGIEGTAETGTHINNQNKEITENGTYTADEGYTGLGTVTVNVPQTGDVPVKLFATIEEMQADPEAKEGDLALVYNSEYAPTKTKTTVDTVMFPKTVTLANKVTKTITGYVRCVDSSRLECSVELTATSYTIRQEDLRPVKTIVEYMSTDGITYIRKTTLADDMYTFNSAYEWRTSWSNEILDNFVLTIRKKFNGLFDYRTGLDNNYIELYGNVVVSGYNKYTADIENIKIDKLAEMASKMQDELGLPRLYVVIKNDNGTFFYRYADSGIPGVIVYGDDYYRVSQNYTRSPKSSVDKYTLDLENMTYTKTTLTSSSTYEYQTVYETIPKTSFIGILNLTTLSNKLEMFGHNTSSSTSTNPMLNTSRTNISMTYGTFTKYLIAKSQLDDISPSDLLPGKTGYGGLGVVTGDGTIYNSFNLYERYHLLFGDSLIGISSNFYGVPGFEYNQLAMFLPNTANSQNVLKYGMLSNANDNDTISALILPIGCTQDMYVTVNNKYLVKLDRTNGVVNIIDTSTHTEKLTKSLDGYASSSVKNGIGVIVINDYTIVIYYSYDGIIKYLILDIDNDIEHLITYDGSTKQKCVTFNIGMDLTKNELYYVVKETVSTTSASLYVHCINLIDYTDNIIYSKSFTTSSVDNVGNIRGIMTNNKQIFIQNIYSTSSGTMYYTCLLNRDGSLVKELANTTNNFIYFTSMGSIGQEILYDDGTYLYYDDTRINKSSFAKESYSGINNGELYTDFFITSFSKNYNDVLTCYDLDMNTLKTFNIPESIKLMMTSGNYLLCRIVVRVIDDKYILYSSLGKFYDAIPKKFTENVDMSDSNVILLNSLFSYDSVSSQYQYKYLTSQIDYTGTITPTEYDTAVDTSARILGNTTE